MNLKLTTCLILDIHVEACVQCKGSVRRNNENTWNGAVFFGIGFLRGKSSVFSWKVCKPDDRGRSMLAAPDWMLYLLGLYTSRSVCGQTQHMLIWQHNKIIYAPSNLNKGRPLQYIIYIRYTFVNLLQKDEFN